MLDDETALSMAAQRIASRRASCKLATGCWRWMRARHWRIRQTARQSPRMHFHVALRCLHRPSPQRRCGHERSTAPSSRTAARILAALRTRSPTARAPLDGTTRARAALGRRVVGRVVPPFALDAKAAALPAAAARFLALCARVHAPSPARARAPSVRPRAVGALTGSAAAFAAAGGSNLEASDIERTLVLATLTNRVALALHGAPLNASDEAAEGQRHPMRVGTGAQPAGVGTSFGAASDRA